MVNDKEVPMGRYKSNDFDLAEKDKMILGTTLSVRGAVLHTFKDKNPANKVSIEYKISGGQLTLEKESSGYETANLMVVDAKYAPPIKE